MARTSAVIMFFVLIAAVVIGAESHAVRADGVGFYPSALELPNALRGQRYQLNTTVLNESAMDRIFVLHSDGDAGSWISFAQKSDPETLIQKTAVPAHARIEVIVYFKVPIATPNGQYTAKNYYDGYTASDYETQTGVVIGLSQEVTIDVSGTQVLDLQVRDVFGRDVEVGEPLRLRAQVTNKGNVDVTPMMQISITTTGSVAATPTSETKKTTIASLHEATDPVKSGQSTTVEALWETGGQAVGQYNAHYLLSVQGKQLKSGDIPFKLLPLGSLTRGGAIRSIEIVGAVKAGAIAQANVRFENTGLTDSRSKFVGQLFRDGQVVSDTTSPVEALARPGEQVTLSTFFAVPSNGVYELRGRVTFEGTQTDEAVHEFTVGAGSQGGNRLVTFLPIPIILGLALAIGALDWWRRRRRHPRAS